MSNRYKQDIPFKARRKKCAFHVITNCPQHRGIKPKSYFSFFKTWISNYFFITRLSFPQIEHNLVNRFNLLNWVVFVWELHSGLNFSISCLSLVKMGIAPAPRLWWERQNATQLQTAHPCATLAYPSSCPIGTFLLEQDCQYLQWLLSPYSWGGLLCLWRMESTG